MTIEGSPLCLASAIGSNSRCNRAGRLRLGLPSSSPSPLASAPGKSMAIIGPPSQALAVVVKANGRVLASNAYVTIARF